MSTVAVGDINNALYNPNATYQPISALWQANTEYKAGQLVVNNGLAYTAIADFTSGGSFNAANWTLLAAGVEVGYTADETGTTLALGTSNAALVPSLVIPTNTRPIWLTADAFVDVTTASASGDVGTVTLSILDPSAGTLAADIATFEGANGVNGFAVVRARGRIPAGTAGGTYTLAANRGGNSSFRANIMNGLIAAAFRTSLSAQYA